MLLFWYDIECCCISKSLSLELLTEECCSASGCTLCSLSKWSTTSDVVEMHLAKRVMAVGVLLSPSLAMVPFKSLLRCSICRLHAIFLPGRPWVFTNRDHNSCCERRGESRNWCCAKVLEKFIEYFTRLEALKISRRYCQHRSTKPISLMHSTLNFVLL